MTRIKHPNKCVHMQDEVELILFGLILRPRYKTNRIQAEQSKVITESTEEIYWMLSPHSNCSSILKRFAQAK